MRRRVDLDFFSRDCQSCDLCAVAYSLLSEYAERRKFCTSIFGPRLEYVFWNTWNTVGILNTGRIQPFTALLEILWNTVFRQLGCCGAGSGERAGCALPISPGDAVCSNSAAAFYLHHR